MRRLTYARSNPGSLEADRVDLTGGVVVAEAGKDPAAELLGLTDEAPVHGVVAEVGDAAHVVNVAVDQRVANSEGRPAVLNREAADLGADDAARRVVA